MAVTADEIKSAVGVLLGRYGETQLMPASSLHLELGVLKTTWAAIDQAYQTVGGKVSGTDYPPTWVVDHAEELAQAINQEMA